MEGAPESETFSRYDDTLAPLVRSIHDDDGIPTYVVGIDIVDAVVDVPVANPFERLSEVAVAGGVPRDGDEPFFNARDQNELGDALAAIASSLQCELALAGLPADPARVHLRLGDSELSHSADCSDASGWRYAATDGAVQLCAASCDDFAATGTMHAAFDCVPEK
jgi:hypothetical protein